MQDIRQILNPNIQILNKAKIQSTNVPNPGSNILFEFLSLVFVSDLEFSA